MVRAEVDALRAGAEALGIELSDDAAARILRHLELLDVWNRRFHLTGERDRATLVAKHAVDSLAALWMLPGAGRLIDVGSGAGFPGIILACARPDLELLLIEPRRRPCSFLSESIRTIPIPRARVVESRVEDTVAELGGSAAAVTSRALRLDLFLRLAAPLLADDGSVIAMQTPRVDGSAVAEQAGLQLAETRDYTLPEGGEARRLLRFTRL